MKKRRFTPAALFGVLASILGAGRGPESRVSSGAAPGRLPPLVNLSGRARRSSRRTAGAFGGKRKDNGIRWRENLGRFQ